MSTMAPWLRIMMLTSAISSASARRPTEQRQAPHAPLWRSQRRPAALRSIDRLGGRWDRFSWFGLLSVEADGELSDSRVPWNQDVVVETMEALLIESLEPPLNRRRGDNLSGIEYLHTPDPQIEAARKKALLDEIRRGAGL
jgi:hypothetical protein